MGSKNKICFVSSPRSMASVMPLSNFLDILSGIYHSVYVITGNEGSRALNHRNNISGYSLTYKPGKNLCSRILGHILFELKVCLKMVQVNPGTSVYLFFMAEGMLLPVLLSKILCKPVLLILAGSTLKILSQNRNIFNKPLELIECLNYRLASGIVIYSPALVDEWGLAKYKHKIKFAREHFLDFNSVTIRQTLEERVNTVGYIGRLSQEKGVLNFLQAIPRILNKTEKMNFLIGGDGPLKTEVEQYLDENHLRDKVELLNWISHDALPAYLNTLKLLVLPSYTEGLPNIMLEAMACGTPVLATPVGAVPDFIKEGYTGFIMQNNSPECIAENILRVMGYTNLEQTIRNALSLVQRQFTFEKAAENYKRVLAGMGYI